jgi:hypothetical protein
VVAVLARLFEILVDPHTITAADPSPTTSARPSKPSLAPASSRTNVAELGC